MIPALPFAHALVAKQDLPIPAWLFAWAASIVLVVSFFALSAAWRKPQFEDERWRPSAAWLTAVLRLLAAAGSLRRPRRLPARDRDLRRHPRHRSSRSQLRDHLLLRHRLDRLPVRVGPARQCLPDLQPVAGDRARGGRRLRAPRPPPDPAPRLPGEARPLARRDRPARLRLARGRLRVEWRRRGRARTARGGRRRLRLHRLHAGDDGPLRHRGVVRARRDLLGLLRDVLRARPVRREGRPHRPAPPARRRGALGDQRPRLDRRRDRLDRLDQLRRGRGRRLQIGAGTRRQVDRRHRLRPAGDGPHHRLDLHGGHRLRRQPPSTCSG